MNSHGSAWTGHAASNSQQVDVPSHRMSLKNTLLQSLEPVSSPATVRTPALSGLDPRLAARATKEDYACQSLKTNSVGRSS